MKDYLISVIIPVFNAKEYVQKCIDSVLNQTLDDMEIICVDDGSTDGTTQILTDYEGHYSNIYVIKKEHQGVLQARRDGLSTAHGKYVGWVDADDYIEPQMYEKLYNLITSENADYVYCDYNFFPKEVSTKARWFKEWQGVMDWKFLERNTQCWKSLTKKTLLDELDIANKYERFGEYTWISVILNAKKIAYTKERLYNYRVGHVSLSSDHFSGRVPKFRSGKEQASHLKELLRDTEYEKSLSEYFDYRYIYTLLQLEIVAAINRDKKAYEEAGSELSRMKFKTNSYTKKILDYNHGKIRSFVLRNIIPSSYGVAVFATRCIY